MPANRIVNKYGALRYNGLTKVAIEIAQRFDNDMMILIREKKLSPVEIRCLAATFTMSTVFAEATLRATFVIKRAERELKL